MMFWICCAVTLIASVGATLMSDLRVAALSLWITGLGVGGLYLSMGAELLAIVQWLVSTVIAISFIFYAVTFGEYGVVDQRPWSQRLRSLILPAIAGVGFVSLVWAGARDGAGSLDMAPRIQTLVGHSLIQLAKTLVEEHLLSLEVLGLTLLVVIVGAGVVSRPEVIDR